MICGRWGKKTQITWRKIVLKKLNVLLREQFSLLEIFAMFIKETKKSRT